jgi:hypothetical protein
VSDYADELYDDELYDEAPTFDAETFAAMEDAAEAARVAYDEAFDEALAESEARWEDEDAAREALEQEAASLEAAEQNAAMLIVNGCEQAGIVDDAARAEVYRLAEGLVRDPDFHHDPRGRAEAAIGKAVELVSTPKTRFRPPAASSRGATRSTVTSMPRRFCPGRCHRLERVRRCDRTGRPAERSPLVRARRRAPYSRVFPGGQARIRPHRGRDRRGVLAVVPVWPAEATPFRSSGRSPFVQGVDSCRRLRNGQLYSAFGLVMSSRVRTRKRFSERSTRRPGWTAYRSPL